MTYEEIYELGWLYEDVNRPCGAVKKQNETFYINEDGERWIMATYLDRYGNYNLTIKLVDEKVDHNEWENSDTYFYGRIKSKCDLDLIMQMVGIKDY